MSFKELWKSISRPEWRFLFWVSLIVILVISAPQVYGWLNTPPDTYFNGLHFLAPGDTHVYYSYLEQVRQGHFVFKDLYTSEPQARIYFNIFWLGLGLLGKLFNFFPILTFHLGRVLLAPFLIISLYLLISFFLKEKIRRQLAIIFFVASSGLGGLLAPILEKFVYQSYGYYHWPMDLWVAEANTFLSLYHSPHYIFSTGLIVLIILALLLAFQNNKVRYSLSAGFLGLLLFSFHPFHVPTFLFVFGFYLLVKFIQRQKIPWSEAKHTLLFFLISSPSVLYYLFLLKYDWITLERTIQNVLLTPRLWLTLISYGFLLVFALVGVYDFLKNKKSDERFLFLVIWLFIQFLLLYSPFNFQRHLAQGLQIPMVILAIEGLFLLKGYLKEKLKPQIFEVLVNNKILLLFLFISLFSFSNIFNLTRDFVYYYRRLPFFYFEKDRVRAMWWLKDNISENSVTFSHWNNGNFIPGWAGRPVFIGHEGVETLFFHQKKEEVRWFFSSNKVDEKKIKFLKKNNINYIFWSDLEKELGRFRPQEKNYLRKVYENNLVAIYKVITEP